MSGIDQYLEKKVMPLNKSKEITLMEKIKLYLIKFYKLKILSHFVTQRQ